MKVLGHFFLFPTLLVFSFCPGIAQSRQKVVTITIDWVTIPAGSFLMGNPGVGHDEVYGLSHEYPQHEVVFNYSFQIGKYEVTNEEYAAILNWANAKMWLRGIDGEEYNGGNVYYNTHELMRDIFDCDIEYSDGQFVPKTRNGRPMGRYPVRRVSWYGAVAFCNWLSEVHGFLPCYDLSPWTVTDPHGGGYRLPSESEWEYACRGSSSNPNRYAPFYFGEDPTANLEACAYNPQFDPFMVWCGNTDEPMAMPEPVGSKIPNDYGLHDMHGNVGEWCQDWWHLSYDGAPADGSAWELPAHPLHEHRISRGAGFTHTPRLLRSAMRNGGYPTSLNASTGFRLVRDDSQAEPPSEVENWEGYE